MATRRIYVLEYSFTLSQWGFLQELRRQSPLPLVVRSAQMQASTLSPTFVTISDGAPEAVMSRLRQRKASSGQRLTSATLSEIGSNCAVAKPQASPKYSKTGKDSVSAHSLATSAAAARETPAEMSQTQRYSVILAHGMPVTISLLNDNDRSAAMTLIEDLRDGDMEYDYPLLRKVATAWNDGIYARIPDTKDPQFLEMREKLPIIRNREDCTTARFAIEGLLITIPTATAAHEHLKFAKSLLVEAEELYARTGIEKKILFNPKSATGP